MSNITNHALRAVGFIRSRVGAILLFVLCCFVCTVSFSSYLAPVNIVIGGEVQTVLTVRGDAKEILTQAGIALDSGDEYVVSLGETGQNREIAIIKSFPIGIVDAGVPYDVDVANGTVVEAIEKLGIDPPGQDDVLNYSPDAAVFAGMNITIDRVEYLDTAETQPIRFKTVKVDNPDMLKTDEPRTVTMGEYGEKTVVTRHKYVNGELVSSEIISETVTKDTISEVIEVGTATATTAAPTQATQPAQTVEVPAQEPAVPADAAPVQAAEDEAAVGANTFVDNKGRTMSYSKTYTGKATAYTANPGSGTASGRPVGEGFVAVDPSLIPYGTNLYITSADGKFVYGYAVAADTGSALTSGKVLVDVFYDSMSKCKSFGRRDVIVYILD